MIGIYVFEAVLVWAVASIALAILIHKVAHMNQPAPKTVWALSAEFDCDGEGHIDLVGVFHSLKEAEEALTWAITDGYDEMDDFDCYVAIEYEVGSKKIPLNPKVKRWDRAGHYIPERSTVDEEGKISNE